MEGIPDAIGANQEVRREKGRPPRDCMALAIAGWIQQRATKSEGVDRTAQFELNWAVQRAVP